MYKYRYLLFFVFAIFTFFQATETYAATDDDLLNLPIESLMKLTVTSVSKKSQQLTNAAAAVFVISEEDIKRSGATTIADALRMVPGIQVARVDSSKWAVTARGLNSRFANKLLVLQDGRSLYTPLFSGVYWEVQDTALEDIERIEVIRGPGAALWGANAVNGVINIITKSAEDTKGGFVSGGGGTSESRFATLRYGTGVGNASFLRFYGKYNEHAAGLDTSGKETFDSWNMARGGFRLDSNLSSRDSMTFQGDYYDGRLKETYKLYTLATPGIPDVVNSNAGASGGNLLARWQRTVSPSENLSLQLYFDHNERNMLVLPQKFDTVDLDFQHHFSLLSNQDIVWGVGYRFNRDQVSKTDTIDFTKAEDNQSLFSAFLHDEITIMPGKISLMLGSRFEKNDYSGFEVQPNARILYTPAPQHSLWAAVSRAVRTPSLGEQDYLHYQILTLPAPSPTGSTIIYYDGKNAFKSEELLAYEVGYRVEPLNRLTFDIAAYYNVYSRLRVASGNIDFTKPENRLSVSNDMHGHSFGTEVSAEWSPLAWWRLQAAYSYQNLKMYLDNGTVDPVNMGNAEKSTPKNQLSLRSGFDLGKKVTLDLWLRGVDRIEQVNEMSQTVSVPGYVTMDLRMAWKLDKKLEVSVVGQNLFATQHREFYSDVVNTLNSETPRSVYGKVTFKF